MKFKLCFDIGTKDVVPRIEIDILLFYYTIISIVEHMKYNQEIPEKSNIAFNFCIAFAMTDHSNTCRT